MIDISKLTEQRDCELAQKVVRAFKNGWWFNECFDDLKVRPYLEKDINVTYLCTHEGEITESVTRVIFFVDYERTKIYMPNMQGGIWVHPEFRQRGIGRSIIETMEEIGREIPVQEIQVAGVDNPSFWSNMRYIQKGPKEFYKKLT